MQYVVLKTTYYDTNITISIYKSQQTNADDLRQKPLKCTAERTDFMFRMWAKIWRNNHMIKDTVVEDASDRGRTQKVFHAMDEVIYTFDLGKPIWLDKTVKEFQNHSRARFYQDNFIETIDFEYLEIQMIEED